ncbi:MAG: DegT/DnrJ/EryC1/StrS family aminotransferase [Candidatus Komeilibacteria bacterium]|nr:DegT/DnrJ/EryC1/StrS family aminotransferase [Candidatus Komeilibacteria bacterium]
MKLISASFFTTISGRQARAALGFMLPWNWGKIKRGAAVAELENFFKKMLGVKYAQTFYNARGALYHGLKAIGITSDDEVIIQAYTCVSVANAIIAVKAKPVYADISLTDLNLDPSKLESLITSKTKAIIVQHNFGLPADIRAIKAIADQHGLKLVEDCAHSLGAKYQGQPVGTFGEFSVFSFGRDKVISGVNGGLLVTNSPEVFNKLPKGLPLPKFWVILQNLRYPIIALKSFHTYYFLSLGKALIALSKKLKLIPEITSSAENQCLDASILNYNLPNCLALLILKELPELEKVNAHRQKLALLYQQKLNSDGFKVIQSNNNVNENIYLRCVALTANKKSLDDFLKKHGIIFGNWYDQTVAPKKASLSACQYVNGSCPNSELAADQTLNLPNHLNITLADAAKVIKLIQQWRKLQ